MIVIVLDGKDARRQWCMGVNSMMVMALDGSDA
jgi:hypothetical protein